MFYYANMLGRLYTCWELQYFIPVIIFEILIKILVCRFDGIRRSTVINEIWLIDLMLKDSESVAVSVQSFVSYS